MLTLCTYTNKLQACAERVGWARLGVLILVSAVPTTSTPPHTCTILPHHINSLSPKTAVSNHLFAVHHSPTPINILCTRILWASATMSDATLPPPRSSPRLETEGKEHLDDEAPHAPGVDRSSSVMGDGAEGSNENRTGSKQRRKRTRYALNHPIQWQCAGEQLHFICIPPPSKLHPDYINSAFRLHSHHWLQCARPEDQAILEAEYKRNPKPNKAARADIVEKVTLNEKEVQVSIAIYEKDFASRETRVPVP